MVPFRTAGAGAGVVVVVDQRERGSRLLELLQARWPRTVEGRLPLGDVWVGSRVLCERKTIPDFAASLADGRLFRQARELAGSAERPLFVIEGVFDPLVVEETGLAPNGYRGALVSLVVGYGIPVLRTRSVRDTASWIARIAHRETRRTERARARRETLPPADPVAGMLAALPGIGWRRATSLLDEFGSVEAVFQACPERLQKVQGIGGTLATYLASLGEARRTPPDARGCEGEGPAGVVSEPRRLFGRGPSVPVRRQPGDGMRFAGLPHWTPA